MFRDFSRSRILRESFCLELNVGSFLGFVGICFILFFQVLGKDMKRKSPFCTKRCMLELVEEEEIKYIPTGILKHFLAAISLFTYFKQENIKDHISIPIGTLCHFLPRKVP